MDYTGFNWMLAGANSSNFVYYHTEWNHSLAVNQYVTDRDVNYEKIKC